MCLTSLELRQKLELRRYIVCSGSDDLSTAANTHDQMSALCVQVGTGAFGLEHNLAAGTKA